MYLYANENIDFVHQSMYSPGMPEEYAVSGNYAYAVGSKFSLYILDLSNTEGPSIVSVYNTPGVSETEDIAIMGNAAVLYQHGKISLVDISNPIEPQLISSVQYTGDFGAKAVNGNITLIITNNGDLLCYDFTNLQNPILADSLHYNANLGYYPSLGVIGSRAYLSGLGDWKVLNISDPYNIGEMGSVPNTSDCIIYCYGNEQIYGVASHELQIYAENPSGELILCSSPYASFGIARVRCGSGFIVLTFVDTFGPCVMYCYRFVNVSDPFNPVIYGATLYSNERHNKISVSNDYYFMFTSDTTYIYQVNSTGASLADLGLFYNAAFSKIVMNSNYAFIKEGAKRITLIEDPLSPNPVICATIPDDNEIFYINEHNNDLFVTVTSREYYVDHWGWKYTNGFLKVYDCSVPENPQLKYNYQFLPDTTYPDDPCGSISFVDTLAYFTFGNNLMVADISAIDHLNPLDYVSGMYIDRVSVYGNYAFAWNHANLYGQPMLYIYDISVPSLPVWISSLTVPDQITAVGAYGSYVYVGGYFNSILTVDISDPLNPTIVGSYASSQPVYKIEAHPNYLAVISGQGLMILNRSNMPILTQTGYYNLQNTFRDFIIIDDLLIMAQTNGLAVYNISAATALCTSVDDELVPEPMMITIYPNPFTDMVTIDYLLNRNAKVGTNIYNLKGQKVFGIPEMNQAKGKNSLTWNANDHYGRPLPSGIYFLSVTADKKSYTRKLTLIR